MHTVKTFYLYKFIVALKEHVIGKVGFFYHGYNKNIFSETQRV